MASLPFPFALRTPVWVSRIGGTGLEGQRIPVSFRLGLYLDGSISTTAAIACVISANDAGLLK
jgi:hypothetical protein